MVQIGLFLGVLVKISGSGGNFCRVQNGSVVGFKQKNKHIKYDNSIITVYKPRCSWYYKKRKKRFCDFKQKKRDTLRSDDAYKSRDH